MTSKQATSMGELTFKRTVKFILARSKRYYYANVFYKDIEFSTGMNFILSPTDVEYMLIAFVKREIIPLVKTCDQSLSAGLINRCEEVINLLRNKGTTMLWSFESLNEIFLHNILQRLLIYNKSGVIFKAIGDGDEIRGVTRSCAERQNNFEKHGLDLCRIQYTLRAKIKILWRKTICARYQTDDVKAGAISTLQRITGLQRRVCWDIETSFVPHSKEEQTITCIHTTLYDYGAHTCPYEHRTFIHIAPERRVNAEAYQKTLAFDYGSIVKLCSEHIGERLTNLNMEPGKTYFIEPFLTEKALLERFVEYVKETRCHSMAYFNGHKFDLPMVMNRMAKLGVNGMREEKGVKQRKFKFSFSYRYDEGYIKYHRTDKTKNYKLEAMKQYIEDERRRMVLEDDSLVNLFDDNEKDLKIEATGNPLVDSRNINHVTFHDVGIIDIMLEVGDRNRGCKLDVACQKFLGVRKFNDKAVSYENLTKTWKCGDLSLFIGYCALDVILTMMLDVWKKTSYYYMADSTLSF